MNLIDQDTWWSLPETHANPPVPDSHRLRRLGWAIGVGIVVVVTGMLVGVVWFIAT